MPDINILFCYARKDKDLFIQLKNHLQPLKRQGFISEWSDNTISPGTAWQQELATQLDSASIIALLISPDFFASDDMYSVAMQHVIKQHEEGKARVIPILLKTVNWRVPPFAELSPLPTNARPVTEWRDRNKAFLDITEALQAVIQSLQSRISEQQEDSVFVRVKDVVLEEKVPTSEEEVPQSKEGLGTTLLRYDIHSGWVCVANWSPNGKQIVSGGIGGIARIWDSATGHNFITYRNHTTDSIFPAKRVVRDAKWSPDGRFVASCGLGVTVRVWDAKTGKNLVLYNHQSVADPLTETYTLSWSPDGTFIASATDGAFDTDQTIHIWNASTGRTQLKYAGHANGVTSIFRVNNIAWSPDGQYIASSGTDKTTKRQRGLNFNPLRSFDTVQIWDTYTGQRLATCIGSFNHIWDLSWSPNSKYIATAEQDATVYIWDVPSGNNVLTYHGHTKIVTAVAWSPDGSRIASASYDHTVHIWHAATGKLLYVYREHTCKVTTVAWSPDSMRIASAGMDGIVCIWQTV